MNITCKTCDHWAQDTQRVIRHDEYGECKVLGRSGMKYILPVLQEQSSGSADIITTANFGCNQHSDK